MGLEDDALAAFNNLSLRLPIPPVAVALHRFFHMAALVPETVCRAEVRDNKKGAFRLHSDQINPIFCLGRDTTNQCLPILECGGDHSVSPLFFVTSRTDWRNRKPCFSCQVISKGRSLGMDMAAAIYSGLWAKTLISFSTSSMDFPLTDIRNLKPLSASFHVMLNGYTLFLVGSSIHLITPLQNFGT